MAGTDMSSDKNNESRAQNVRDKKKNETGIAINHVNIKITFLAAKQNKTEYFRKVSLFPIRTFERVDK